MNGRNLGLSAFLVAVLLGFWSPLASAQKFHLEEATIVDIHRAIKARQINATQLVNLYLKRIEAYNGTCVKGAVDPATGYLLGDIEPVEKAGKLGALITLNLRGKRSKTDPTDNDPAMPDALEVAKTLDAEFAKTGKLKGPLHGIPFAVKDQFDTIDMRSTSGAAPPAGGCRDCRAAAQGGGNHPRQGETSPRAEGFRAVAGRAMNGNSLPTWPANNTGQSPMPVYAACQIRAGRQPKDRQGARADDPGVVPAARRRGDRMSGRPTSNPVPSDMAASSFR
jgi:hypothetical protein